MIKIPLHPAALAFLLTLSAVPSAALAFVTVDTLPWPSLGRFPAYPADETRPTTLWVQGGVMRDDNILRLESAGEGDTITRVGIGIRHEQRIIGRQRVVAEARTDYYDFRRFNSLDHAAYSLAGTWNWEVGNNLAGTVVAGREKRLIDIGEIQEATRDFVTLTRLGATGGLLITPSFRLRGGVATTWGERALRSDIETRGAAWSAGAEYVSPLRNTLGVEYRSTYGDAPERIVAGTSVNDDFREKEVALLGTYSPGPSLFTAARLGRTRRSYTDLPGRDFKGNNYQITARWFPANKTQLFFEAYREPRSILDATAGHIFVRGFDFGPSWAATNKLVFHARYVRERRQFQSEPAIILTGAPLRDEVHHIWRFGVGWEPQRQWQLSAALDHGTRDSNFAGRDYNYKAATLNVAWRY